MGEVGAELLWNALHPTVLYHMHMPHECEGMSFQEFTL